MSNHHFDVVIIGAGISGIGAAYYLQTECPHKSYTILEGREAMGGTWDLFRYPGIRSDSSMLTMAYAFKPWKGSELTAGGESILEYVKEVAEENNIVDHIRYGQQVGEVVWSSAESRWTVQTAAGDTYSCNFLLMCAGYYSYKNGYTPDFEGSDRFNGQIVHPQTWPENLDYAGKKVVVIGSGATAVTLIPKLAEQAKHVVMLQRSPTFMRALPNEDPVSNITRKVLPENAAYRLLRWRSVALQQYFYRLTRRKPEKVKQQMIDWVREDLPPDFDVDTHFTPDYNPWDQRVCLVPDGDLFQAITAGTASVVTDRIDSFTEDGILLKSGDVIEADIVVTATGLNLEVMGGIEFKVDGEPVDFGDTVSYKGMMCSNVPNMVAMFGYINASWTLAVDLKMAYVCRLLNHMDANGVKVCVPRLDDVQQTGTQPYIKDFPAGYMQRSMHLLPRQGESEPWVNTQDFGRDKKIISQAPIEDGVLLFK